MTKIKDVTKAIKNKDKKSMQQLYVNYISALVKSEKLQNKLEHTCSLLISTPSIILNKETQQINNHLNDLLVKVMHYQNAIDYLSEFEIN